jgi:hypothetical protein
MSDPHQVPTPIDGRCLSRHCTVSPSRRPPATPRVYLDELDDHLARLPPLEVTLPWEKPDGRPVTVRLVLVAAAGEACQPLVRGSGRTRWRCSGSGGGGPAA